MNSDQILSDVREVFVEVFSEDLPAVNRQTTADDIEQWDSLSHFELIIAMEKRFGVKITSQETRELGTVASICHLLESKLDSKIA